MESNFDIDLLKETELLNVDFYQKLMGLSFDKDDEAYSHFSTIGQYHTEKLKEVCYPLYLQQQNSNLIDWNIQTNKPRLYDKISIVVPVLNEVTLTIKCLKSILKNTSFHCYEVIIVNNGSDFLTRQILRHYTRALSSQVKVISLKENLNFAIGCNVGFANSDGQYVVFLNNDTQVTKGWLSSLFAKVTEEDVIAVQPKLVYPDGKIQSVGIEFGIDGFGFNVLDGQESDAEASKFSKSCSAITGACFLISADDFIFMRGFDPIYINGQEDIDLSLRLTQYYGRDKLWYCAESVVVHETSQTKGRGKYISQNRKIFKYRWNMLNK